MESHVRTAEHTHVSARRDYLTFRLVLASELIGTFTSRKRLGRPRSDEHAERTLTTILVQWPRPSVVLCVRVQGEGSSFQSVATDMNHRLCARPAKSTSALTTSVGVLKNITHMWITAPEYLSPALLACGLLHLNTSALPC